MAGMTVVVRVTYLTRMTSFPRKHVLAKAGAGIHRLIQVVMNPET